MKASFISHSKSIGTDYHVFVSEPDSGRHPGLWAAGIVVDGDGMFDDFAKAARKLEKEGGPAILAVGIGYGASFGAPENRRVRDYTPDEGEDEPESGGAEAFYDYLMGPFWTELGKRYPLREDVRLLAGHSLGGLFALHTLFRPSVFFNRLLVGSPSIWWNNNSFMRRLSVFRETHSHLPARMFLGIGEKDSKSMTGDFASLESELSKMPFEGLEIISRRFPGKTHYNVLPVLFSEGLESLFEGD